MDFPTSWQPSGEIAPAGLEHAVTLVGGVRGALRSGLLEVLWKWQPCTTGELATRAHLAPRAVELTLDVLEAAGVVDVAEGRWTLAAPPEAWARLVAGEDRISNFVETGAPPCAEHDSGVRVTVRRGGRVLELAADSVPSTTVIDALTNPSRSIDLAHVQRLLIDEHVELIVITGLCSLLRDAENGDLLARCRRALAPEGQVVVCDVVAGVGARDVLAAPSLELASRSAAESLWSIDDYRRWLRHAGCATPRVVHTDAAGQSILVAGLPRTRSLTHAPES